MEAPTKDRSSTRYALAAELLLLTGAVVEAIRAIFARGATSFVHGYDQVVSIGLAALWGVTALAVALRHRAGFMATAAWVLSIASTFAVVAYAFALRVGTAWFGGIYLVAAPILGFLLWKSLGGEWQRLSREARHEA